MDGDPIRREAGESQESNRAAIGATAILDRQDYETVGSDERRAAGAAARSIINDRVLRMHAPRAGQRIGESEMEFALIPCVRSDNREKHPPAPFVPEH